MTPESLRRALAAGALAFAALWGAPLQAQEAACLQCHEALTKGKVVHAAVAGGCATCHAAIDAAVVPHKLTGKIAKGLAAEPPALCYACHEEKGFQGKVTHGPVAAGMCTTCHNPHASDQAGLLTKAPSLMCLDCHTEVKKRPHILIAFSGNGHPLGDEKRPRPVADPMRPGKGFSCVTCHEPHRSDFARLTRFDGKAGMGLCQKCHQK